MSVITRQIVKMIDMLPEHDQQLAFEIIKKMVLAWDPDFTKSTPEEAEAMNRGLKQLEQGDFTRHNDIDWN